MKVRITFRSEIFIDGKDMKEIVSKWENLRLFSSEASVYDADLFEVSSVEDAETYDDVMDKFEHPWDDDDENEEDEKIFLYNGGDARIEFSEGENCITVDLPDEGLNGTFDNVEDLAYALAPYVTIISEKYTLAGMLSLWFGEDEEEVLEWLMK